MAITKIKPIRGTVNKALAYILDPQKTDDAFYVSSYGCAASDAAAKEFEWTRNLAVQQGMQMPKVLARHLIQSFDIGEVTPEEAHEVGKQLADEWLKGKYEYVIATHIDKGHCHNHIIFNAVNYVDFHAYRSNKRTYRELRQLSDEICKEHGLSVIPPSQNKGMDYKEYTEAKRGTSWKQKLKQTIDRLVITAKDYDDFLRLMQEAGYEIKTGKYISFRAEGQERFTRSKTIGENYTEERIKERIAGGTHQGTNCRRNASRNELPDGRPEETKGRPCRMSSPLSEIFRSGSGSSTAKAMSIKPSSQSSRKRRGRSTISRRTTCFNTLILRRRSRMFTALMTVPARS